VNTELIIDSVSVGMPAFCFSVNSSKVSQFDFFGCPGRCAIPTINTIPTISGLASSAEELPE
jgi:hypothetical protein